MSNPWRLGEPLNRSEFERLKRRAIFECCKWDPQIEDVETLSPYPLLLRANVWKQLQHWSQQLARETRLAENELMGRPELHRQLGLPRAVCQAMATIKKSPVHDAPRFLRFDFHFTENGWQISEVNSDVPGGFNEASGYTAMVHEHYPELSTPGHPVAAIIQKCLSSLREGSVVGLVHATAFTDDRQAMVYLKRAFDAAGFTAHLLAPDHLRWPDGRATMVRSDCAGPVDFLFRFFPAEWLPELPKQSNWRHFFSGAATPCSNPATALLTQSKRFPLVWDELSTDLPTWQTLLPKTCDPRAIRSSDRHDWVFKPSLGRVGDGIGLVGTTAPRDLKQIHFEARWFPRWWAAQQKFSILPLTTTEGKKVYPCLGIYTLDDEVVGAYGRISHSPIINHLAQEVAVLIEKENPPGMCSTTKPKPETLREFSYNATI